MKTHRTHFTNGRGLLPVIVLAAAMAAAAAFLLLRSPDTGGTSRLSKATLDVIRGLPEAVEIRFYRNADGAAPMPGLAEFASRTGLLLDAYSKASDGRITVRDLPVKSKEDASGAAADGVRPFNIEKGDAAWLGLALQMGKTRETLPTLSPEFGQALEADMTRALRRLVESKRAADLMAAPPETIAPGTVETVKSLVPNFAEVSLEKGSDKIRENMLSEMHKAGAEFDAKMAEFGTAMERAAGNPAEQEALRKAIQEAGAVQAAKLKEIVTSSTARLKALESLKSQQPQP